MIQGDILSRYNIESDDENRDGKLAVIYEQVLSNTEDNQYLIDYCEQNNIPLSPEKTDSEEYVQNVETAMAHMSHDGTSAGDEIVLGSVDLSQYHEMIELEESDKSRIVINNSDIFEFDGQISTEGKTYSGTISGQKVQIEQNEDSSCSVRYYDDSDVLTKEVIYTPDALTKTAFYEPDEKTVKYAITKDEKGNIISEFKNYGKYAIETMMAADSTEYTVFNGKNKPEYCLSKSEDSDGILHITKYLSSSKTREISDDACYKFQTAESESKYKFSTGNKYSVDISDSEGTITANVSRGSLKAAYTINKTADGFFEFDGKIFQTEDELAAELNHVEISATDDADGEINVSKQGFGVGDCGVLSAINALSYTEYGQQVIDDSFEYNDDGSITINFYGIERAYTVTKEEFENTDYFAHGDKDMIALEIALNKAYSDVVNGSLYVADYSPYWCKTPGELTSETFLITANWPQGVLYLLSGKECSIDDEVDNSTKQAWLNELQTNGGIAISCATTYGDGSSVLRTDTDSCYVSGITVRDAFGENVGIPTLHAYAIKEVNTKTDGNRVVTLVNPWDSGDEIVLDESTYLSVFDLNYAMQIRDNNTYPIYYF